MENISVLKTKDRILAYLLDFALTFIISILLFNVVIFQISRPIISYDNFIEENQQIEKGIFDLLYEHELLFYDEDEDSDKYTFNDAISDTFYHFVEFLVKNDEESSKYDVFYNYYIDIKNEDISFLNNLKIEYLSPFFEKDIYLINGSVSLKKEYIDEFNLLFLDQEMNIKGYEDYGDLSISFVNLYQKILEDIKVNDLVSIKNETTYLNLRNKINFNDKLINDNYFYCSLISFFSTTLLLFLIYPLFSKKHESFGEVTLKLERIKEKDGSYIKRIEVIYIFLIKTIECLPVIFFIPLFKISFTLYSSYLALYIIPLIGVLFLIVNIIFIYTNKTRRGFLESISKTNLVKEDTLS